MKKLIILTAAILFAVTLHAQTSYTIKGQIPAAHKAMRVVMSYPPDDKGGKYNADTANITNGKFEYKGVIGRPQLAELNLILPKPAAGAGRRNESDEGGGMKNVALFYLDGKVDIAFDTAGMATVAGGGQEQSGWKGYEQMVMAKNKALNGAPASMEFFEEVVTDYVKANPDLYVSVDLMDMFTQSSIQPKLIEPMYNSLSKRMQNSEKVLGWKPKLDEAKLAVSGKVTAPAFTLNDTEGKAISLASYRGGYVLVDFWASWCVPCRAENPNVLAAYEKYKDKNFQILGVSLDEKKDLWLKAIAEDKLPWKQVCDFKAAESEVTKSYNISSIPANVLIDPNGKIVAKDLRGKDLHDKLAELIR
ncbi:redoxin domain-containing protein [Pedobacter sp. AW31-3R]|uniref:redoxin domain-containing protein n=1 Tax=Pedobacter sp. AW31-3R TaxID=3445781 RepID=UPI003FA11376